MPHASDTTSHSDVCARYHKSLTNGIQEFIEGAALRHYLLHKTLVPIDVLRARLCFPVDDADGHADRVETVKRQRWHDETSSSASSSPSTNDAQAPSEASGGQGVGRSIPITEMDYLLGIADLSGELMRHALNAVGKNQFNVTTEIHLFLIDLLQGSSILWNAIVVIKSASKF